MLTGGEIQSNIDSPVPNHESINNTKLSPDKYREFTELKEQLNTVDLSKRCVSSYGKNLQIGVNEISRTEDQNDSEFQEFKKSTESKIGRLGCEFKELSEEASILADKISIIENGANPSDKSNLSFKDKLIKDGETNEYVLNLLENKDLSNISAGEVYVLKQEGYDLSKIFLYGIGDISKDNMSIGDTFIVNFGKNNSLNNNVGAGDLLDISQIDNIKVNGVEGERKIEPRPGYYGPDGKYLAIFDSYKVEIVSMNEFTPEENAKSLQAFQNRFENIRKPEILNNLRRTINNSGDNPSIAFEGLSKSDIKLFVSYLTKYVPKERLSELTFDIKKGILSTKEGGSINSVLDNTVLAKNLSVGFENYKDIVNEVAERNGINPDKLKTLIDHENGSWDPMISAPGSSAYGLGQMIDSTWEIYGQGLDRNNPVDQLDATCKYLNTIMSRKGCNIELAMAYYNTGEGILNIGNSKAKEYAEKNPAIKAKLPDSININSIKPKEYLIAATAYYNDITFDQAKSYI